MNHTPPQYESASVGRDVSGPPAPERALGQLYDFVTGDEDARVCKDIPPASCDDQPRNFFAYLGANLLSKVADELSSAKLVLPWLLGALGAPAVFVGLLVPIRESGVLLPQLAVAAYIRRMPRRKPVWILGALLSAAALGAMALAALTLADAAAGWAVLALLVVFSLARGLCSVSAKDVLGKTVSKSRRGRLMGWSAGIAGAATLALGLGLGLLGGLDTERLLYAVLLAGGGVLFLLGALVFAAVREQPGATAGGGNALTQAIASLGLLRTDRDFRRYLITRIGLLTLALAPPFYVLLLQRSSDSAITGLGLLIIASGLAAALSAPFWGRLSDHSARWVMVLAAALGGVTGIATWVIGENGLQGPALTWVLAGLFLSVNIAHAGVRISRKVYLVDLASSDNRAAMVAVSNTIIGVAMLLGGVVGVLADIYDTATVIGVLGLGALGVAAYALRLREVSADGAD
ncbi:MFS transporter [uncultured Thiohalocapsa sp.]|mgnify:CR=1 FL=1|uniref:MFS transporter n=1 Tax=uncultured Thiohalocapsa sp. TaxID=768990 RepID=UPI0025CDE3D8|nr:MFS transporter [uncultured Thiohalocapsa sp.]